MQSAFRVMSTLALLVMLEALRQLEAESEHELNSFRFVVGIMVSVIVTKLALWLFCRSLRSPALRAYAQDHRNDVSYLGCIRFIRRTPCD